MRDYDFAPHDAICPTCRSLCRRRYKVLRRIKDISLDAPKIIKILVGAYKCKNCNKIFRFQPEFTEKGKHYTKRAINKVYTSIQEDKVTFTSVLKRVERDLNIKPSKSTCHRWFHRKARDIDFSFEYEPWVVSTFSGVLAIDEVFDGGTCTFFATDPLNDRTIAFHRSSSRDGEEFIKFLHRLKSIGINPEVFLSDGAPLYENIPNQIFGDRLRHQICTFHFIKNCTKDILDAIRIFRRTLSTEPKKRYKKKHPRNYKNQLEQSKDRKLLWDNRYSFVTRRENLTEKKLFILVSLCYRYPVLDAIRKLVDGLFNLFSKESTKTEAIMKRDKIINDCIPILEHNPHVEKVIRRLQSDAYEKTLTFMDYENLDSTTNQVERTNRWFRKRQKTHYRNRKEENIVNMLKADLIGQMKRVKDKPTVKLRPKTGSQVMLQVA